MRSKPVVIVTGLALALGLIDSAGAAKIYKWTDEKGVTHYGEVIPPEYKDQAAQEISSHGITLRKWDPAPTAIVTPEQRKAADEKAARDREEKQRAFEQRRRDLALVNTYTSAQEIDDARDRTLQLPTQAIRGLEPRLKKAQDRLTGLEQQAGSLAKAGKRVPDGLQSDIGEQKVEVETIQAEIERHKAQIEAIKARYEQDKRRYLEVTQR
jgi:chromosome segregation ATPase